ncbi:MAG: glycoside hydrolase family 28 protein [Breznakia sp.]
MNRYNVLDYGAKSNIDQLQTETFQNAIDDCHRNGGGRVVVPEGNYLISSIRLYSNITFHLLENAVLIGSTNCEDYINFKVPSTLRYLYDDYYVKAWNLPEYYAYGIICAFNENNITIKGEKGSKIDGMECYDPNGEEKFRGPMGIVFSQCQNIHMEGYTFINCANWSHQIDNCENVHANNVSILAGHDGFNLHHCTNIEINNCTLKTGDDCFAGYDIENLIVKKCYMNTACNVFRIGGYNLVFDDCIIEGPGKYPHIKENTYETHRLFKYYSIRPDVIRKNGEKIIIKNSKIKNIPAVIEYIYGEERLMQNNKPLRELIFDNVKIEGIRKKSIMKGNGENCQILFKDCDITLANELDENNFIEFDEYVKIIFDNTEIKSIS